MLDFDELAADLRAGTAHQDDHQKAALELLIWNKGWLQRQSFIRAAVGAHRPGRYIRWAKAREFADSAPRCSTSELNVLRLAIALGEDQFGLGGFEHEHKRAAAKAFAAACGLRLEPDVSGPRHNHPDFIPGSPDTCKACALTGESPHD